MKREDVNFEIMNKWISKHGVAWSIEVGVEIDEIRQDFITLFLEMESEGKFKEKEVPLALYHTKCVLLTRYKRAKRKKKILISYEELRDSGIEVGYDQEYEDLVISEFEGFVEDRIEEGIYPDTIKDIISLILEGYSQIQIEKLIDIPQYTISRWLGKLKADYQAFASI